MTNEQSACQPDEAHPSTNEEALDRKMERVEQLIRSLSNCPDPLIRNQVQDLAGTLMDFHAEALARLLAIVEAHAANAPAVVNAMGSDAVVGSLLLLYDLHPADVSARVMAALAQVRPTLQAHQGDVELVSIEEGRVNLRLQGTCNGCAASTTTFRTLIESAILARVPEIHSIQVEGLAA